MSGLTVGYLIKSAFDLAVEKRIILTEKENPVMIALREYGGQGLNDENITYLNEAATDIGFPKYKLFPKYKGF